MSEKDMIERYIYEVTKRVPQDSREEIRMELEALIEDMCQEDRTVEDVLQDLGSPAEFARRYKDGQDYLIGPEYYDHYIWLNKIALIAITISSVVSAIIQGVTNAKNVVSFFVEFSTEFLTVFFSSVLAMIGSVTIIFVILERQKVKVDFMPKTNWSVDKLSENVTNVKSWTPQFLPPIPDKRAVISRGDCIFTIIFTVVMMVLLVFEPQVFSAFHYDNGEVVQVANIFNLAEWENIAPVFAGCLLICLIDEVIRLVIGYYCKLVMVSSIISNAIQIVCTVFLLYICPIWNPEFVERFKEMFKVTELSKKDILVYWGTPGFSHVMFAFICVIVFIEVGCTIYKTLKYSK